MKARCTLESAPNYAAYGGRGITFDPAWDDFQMFLQDMGPRPAETTLDRLDVNLGYSKANCRWATLSEQQRNKRPFNQPPGRTYGEDYCMDCGDYFVKMSPKSKRCPPCVAYSRRYHKHG